MTVFHKLMKIRCSGYNRWHQNIRVPYKSLNKMMKKIGFSPISMDGDLTRRWKTKKYEIGKRRSAASCLGALTVHSKNDAQWNRIEWHIEESFKLKKTDKIVDGTYHIAKCDNIEKSRFALGIGGIGIFIGEQGRSLEHGIGQLRKFVDRLHLSRSNEFSELSRKLILFVLWSDRIWIWI
jgi:hypothetical protein